MLTNNFFTTQKQQQKFKFFLHSNKTDENQLCRQRTLPEINKKKLSLETFSIDEEKKKDFVDNDYLTVKWQKENNENQNNKKNLEDDSILYWVPKKMFLIGPPNTQDIEVRFFF